MRILERSRAQADRLATIWRVAHDADLSDTEIVQAVLRDGAALLRPGGHFVGSLTRIDEVTDALTTAIVGAGGICAWDDVRADGRFANAAGRRDDSPRALIGTTLQAGRESYCLILSSRLPNREPFDHDDATFVELLARLFATSIQHAKQFDRIHHQITHDGLTGLRNRSQFRLEARAQLSTERRPAALAIVALDAFRQVNELHGHLIGDSLLVEVAAALEACTQGDEIVARLDGARFAILLPHCATREATEARAHAFAAMFARPFPTGDREGKELVPVSATIGVALANREAVFDDLLSRAESAVYLAKLDGPGRIRIDVAESPTALRARRRLRAELAEATAEGEFVLSYQPQLDLFSGRIVGAEALVHWNHPVHGQLLPAQFMPLAEQSGLIRAVNMLVIVEALRCTRVLRRLDPNFRIFVNLTAQDIADSSIVDVFSTAAECGTSLDNLGVELPESAVLHDVAHAQHVVPALQALGIQVAIDNFGTGYASLSLLRRVPVDIVKLHPDALGGAPIDRRDAALIESVLAFGQRSGYTTVAQGVESPELLAWLAHRGCGRAQGDAVGRALSAPDFVRWLRRREPR